MRLQRHQWQCTVEELHRVQGGRVEALLQARETHVLGKHLPSAACWSYSRKVTNKFALKPKSYSQDPVLDGMGQGVADWGLWMGETCQSVAQEGRMRAEP